MFDYKLLEALSTVAETGGFEKASEALFITQSAVSQRVKLLEDQAGRILITRQNPPVPTDAGKKLIKHYRQVKLLESGFLREMEAEERTSYTSLKIGINADSLGTSFLSRISGFLKEEKILIDLTADDQDATRQLLKNGEVSGCISSSKSPVQGCSVTYLGKMEYLMVCTRSFFSRHFDSTLTPEGVRNVPAVLYNTKDNIHSRFLELLFGRQPGKYPSHYVPSIEKFLNMIEMELAYGVIPLFQFRKSRKKHDLIEMTDKRLQIDLYWHRWNIHSDIFDRLSRIIIDEGENLFLE